MAPNYKTPEERAEALCKWLEIKVPQPWDLGGVDGARYRRIVEEFRECEKLALENDAAEKAEQERYG